MTTAAHIKAAGTLMTRAQVIAYLGKSKRTVAQYMADGKLPTQYVSGPNGREARFDSHDVERLKREIDTPIERTVGKPTAVAKTESEPLRDLGPLLFDDAGNPEPVSRLLDLATTLQVTRELGIPRRDALEWHRAAVRAALPPAPKPWLTLDEAHEFSGLPKAWLLSQARRVEYGIEVERVESCVLAINVGTAKRARWMFNREALAR